MAKRISTNLLKMFEMPSEKARAFRRHFYARL